MNGWWKFCTFFKIWDQPEAKYNFKSLKLDIDLESFRVLVKGLPCGGSSFVSLARSVWK